MHHAQSRCRLTGIGAHGKVARVLVHAWRRLADARVGDKVNLDTGIGMLKDGMLDAIAFFKRAFILPRTFGRERSNE